MNRTLKVVILAVTLGLIAATGIGVNWMRTSQKLGEPGIKAEPIPGERVVVNIDLPERVLNYTSTNIPQTEVVTNFLPKDTSYAQRFYQAPDGFWANANIILMGTDRSSIHKADYCLAGQGWRTVKKEQVMITVPGPVPYEMPIAKWSISKVAKQSDGSEVELRGVYSFWFVADGLQTLDNSHRILMSYRDLLTRGVLQRWAYVSYLVVCPPGQEDAAFDRLKELITASVPQFQKPLTTPPTMTANASERIRN